MKFCLSSIKKIHLLFLFLFLAFLFQIPHVSASGTEDTGQKIKLEYFYLNPCGQCNEDGEFREKIDRLLGDEKQGVHFEISTYNTFKEKDNKLFKEYCRKYDIPDEQQKVPILFINDRYLAGKEQIEADVREVFLNQKQTVVSEILYFYVTSCGECEKVSKFLSSLDRQYQVDTGEKTFMTRVELRKLNVEEAANLEQVRTLFSRYGVPESQQEVPVIFFKDGYLAGEAAISQSLADEIQKGKAVGSVLSGKSGPEAIQPGLSAYQAAGVFFTGLLNGLNPCSISMLLFFLSLLLVKQSSLLKLGISFIAGKLVAYALLGTLLYRVLVEAGAWFHSFQGALKILLTVVSLLLVLINLQDFIAAKSEKYGKIKLQLPRVLREFNHNLIRKMTASDHDRFLLPASFLLGMGISAGELLCTGQIYLATIVYVLKTSSTLNLQAVSYFVLYGLALVLPLLALTILVHKGRELFDVSEIVRTKMHWIKLANALFFLAFAAAVLIFF